MSEPIADARPASALAFDPRTSLGYPPLFLDREPRRTAAYWGLQGPTTTLFYQRTDDRYGAGWDDAAAGERYRRRTVEVKMGTSVR